MTITRSLAVGAALLSLAACTTATEPAATETPAPAVETTEVSTTEAHAVETTEPADEFQTWLVSKIPTIMSQAEAMQSVAPLLDAGDIAGAADVSTSIGETYTDLYMDAPETGTELSDVANLMLLTCSSAYLDSGAALTVLNVAALDDATVAISECSDLITRTTDLLP